MELPCDSQGRTLASAVVLVFGVRFHHHFHGSPIGYGGIAAAAAASWVGVPGPGEAVAVTAGILARHNRLDVASIVGAAWLGATLGGVGGWLIGLRAGHAAFAAPGPLHRARLAALVQGERFFERFGPIAVFLTPSWVAGINAMRASRFLPFNAIAALAWALATGVGGYLVGPPVIDLLSDIGLYGSLALVLLLVVSVLGARTGRRRRRQRRART